MTRDIFCQELESKSANVFHRSDSGLLAARWDQFPVRPGHVEIVTTRHVGCIKHMTQAELAEIMVYVQEVQGIVAATDLTEVYWKMSGSPVNEAAAKLIARALHQLRRLPGPPQAFTVAVNDGKASGQTIDHFHLHCVGRWGGDVAHSEGGFRHMFPDDLYAR